MATCCLLHMFSLMKRDIQRFLQRTWSVNEIEILSTSSSLNGWRDFWWMLPKKMAGKITLGHKTSQRKYRQMGTQSFRDRAEARRRSMTCYLCITDFEKQLTGFFFFCGPHCCRLLPWPLGSWVRQWNATANYVFVGSREHLILKTGAGGVWHAVNVGEDRSSVQKGKVLRH